MPQAFEEIHDESILIPKQRDLHKGAWSEEARLALAYAVQAEAKSVMMDGKEQGIYYNPDHVHVQPTRYGYLPQGNFNYDELRARIKDAENEST